MAALRALVWLVILGFLGTDSMCCGQALSGTDAVERLPAVEPSGEVWWESDLRGVILTDSQPLLVDVEHLVLEALAESAQINVLRQTPLIEETRVFENGAAFDWTSFVESRWNDLSDPVGNDLTVGGGRTRSLDRNFVGDVGVRRRNPIGGDISIAQRFGTQRTNSDFFNPNNQGTTRLSLSYTQPLLRGGGKVFNRSQIVLAQINSEAEQERYLEALQLYLLEVVRAYWRLYETRGILLQKRRLLKSALDVLGKMRLRDEVDTSLDQISRAEAAAARRRADLFRAETDVLNAQDRLRQLVNSRRLQSDWNAEFLPQDRPFAGDLVIDLREQLSLALQRRPEVLAALDDIRSASVRKRISEHELLPELNAILETYASGLNGNFNTGRSFADQFRVGRPSYSVGLNFEVPIGRREARARDRRQELELARFGSQFEAVLEDVTFDVRLAVRELETLQRERGARYESMLKAKEEMLYIQRRLELLPTMNKTTSLYLENLLTSQERLALAEFEYLRSQVNFAIGLVRLRQVTGTLLEPEVMTWTLIPATPDPYAPDHDPGQVLPNRSDTQSIESAPILPQYPLNRLPPPIEAPQNDPSDGLPGTTEWEIPPLPDDLPESPPLDLPGNLQSSHHAPRDEIS